MSLFHPVLKCTFILYCECPLGLAYYYYYYYYYYNYYYFCIILFACYYDLLLNNNTYHYNHSMLCIIECMLLYCNSLFIYLFIVHFLEAHHYNVLYVLSSRREQQ